MNLLKLFYFALFFSLFFLVSCEKYIGGDINQDPDAPSEVPIHYQIPAIQVSLTDLYGGEFSRVNSAMMQQVDGIVRCCGFSAYQYSNFTPEFMNTSWSIMYEKILNELNLARHSARNSNFNHYEAIIDILEASAMMMATDVWDDIPYTDALKGIENFNPTYDKQSFIYSEIYRLLDNGISLLSGPQGELSLSLGDLYFKGDIGLWVKSAYGLKARALIHEGRYEEAETAAQNSFTNEAGNMAFIYPDENNAAPWYRFNDARTGDINLSYSFRDMMNDLNDTFRLAVVDHHFDDDHPYLTAHFKNELITYREMLFVLAEVDVRRNQGGSEVGYNAYLAGIKASFERFGLSEVEYKSYISQPEINPGEGNLSLEMVMTQKYIALFLQPEIYNDWRRTEYPLLIPTYGPSIPVRWHYGSDEYEFNSNAPAESEIDIINDRVGWNR